MGTRIQLPDGTILEAPDGADPSTVAKAYLAKQQQSRPRVTGERGTAAVKRELGLGARNILEGGMDVVAPFADLIGYGVNKVLPGDPLPYNHSQNFSQLLTRAGLPEPQGAGEKGVNLGSRIAVGAMAGRGIDKAVLGAMGSVPAAAPVQTPAQRVLAQAQKEGMVVPPAQAAPRSMGAALEGLGGSLKTGQQAAAKNQPLINEIAARAVGVSDEALSPELLQAIRAEAGNAHRVIRSVGEVVTDDDFIKQIQNAAKPFRSTQAAFPKLAAANQTLIDIADDVAKKTFDADAAVDAIQMLRENASVAYRAGANNQGSAYKSMANALEGAIERHLERQSGQAIAAGFNWAGAKAAVGLPSSATMGDIASNLGLNPGATAQEIGAALQRAGFNGGSNGSAARDALTAFRQARQLIAKTYTVEDALKGSNVDIGALGRMLTNGAPLTDELKMLGEFSQQFPGAANLTSALKARPAYSPLDAVTAFSSLAAAGATQNPSLAIPAAYAAGRPLARALALSPAVQRQMMVPLAQKLAPAVPYALGAAPTLAQFLAQQGQR